MQPLVNDQPGRDECWEELAEHALTHDDLGSPLRLAAAAGTLRVDVDPVTGAARALDGDAPLPRHPQRGERGWDWP
jgi:hypothetical protein